MAVFFNDLLEEFLTPAFLGEVRQKFHFGESDEREIRAVAEEMLPLMRKEAFWERKGPFRKEQHKAGNGDATYELVAMSLGKGVDSLQESYHKKDLLLQSYMLEVLAGELLMRGYRAYRCYIRKSVGWHVSRYHFLGSEEGFPLELLPYLLNVLTQQISCNSAFCMLPQKSVVFVSELSKDEKVKCKDICDECNNMNCPNRKNNIRKSYDILLENDIVSDICTAMCKC